MYFNKLLKYQHKKLKISDLLSQIGGAPFPEDVDNMYGITESEKQLCSILLDNDADFTKVLPDKKISDNYLRCKAHQYGQVLLNKWLKAREEKIQEVLTNFDIKYNMKTQLNATTFNDLYKWTMLPVIRQYETLKGNITVTFGIDLREQSMRNALKNKDGKLVELIWNALKGLENRPFDRNVFTEVYSGPRAKLLEKFPGTIDAICGPVGSPRTLVDKGGVKPYNTKYVRTAEDADKITVEFYFDETKNIVEKDEIPGIHFIQVTGPWHKVTWLETSMMQCVYEAKLRYDLNNNSKGIIPYSQWLYGALLRCAKSVAYSRLVQAEAKRMGKTMAPALFTGRRTGGYAFLLLQNLFFADHFLQNRPPALGGPFAVPNSLLLTNPDPNVTVSLGTSSVDSWVKLRQLNLPCLGPAGTHAHELSMVGSILYPQLDRNKYNIPLTQILGHYLYYELVWKHTGGPMAMLPDTLGTRAFMKAANLITVVNKDNAVVPFIKVIQTARQDSGELEDFVTNMKEFNYINPDGSSIVISGMPNGIMASEIDTTDKLFEANKDGYNSFGAGGFFGDSIKVWGKSINSNSMAVKAVKVEYNTDARAYNYDGLPYIEAVPTHVSGYPVKTGDPKTLLSVELPSKLSLNRNLDDGRIQAIRDYLIDVRTKALNPVLVDSSGSVGRDIPIESFFNIDSGIIESGLAQLGVTL